MHRSILFSLVVVFSLATPSLSFAKIVAYEFTGFVLVQEFPFPAEPYVAFGVSVDPDTPVSGRFHFDDATVPAPGTSRYSQNITNGFAVKIGDVLEVGADEYHIVVENGSDTTPEDRFKVELDRDSLTPENPILMVNGGQYPEGVYILDLIYEGSTFQDTSLPVQLELPNFVNPFPFAVPDGWVANSPTSDLVPFRITSLQQITTVPEPSTGLSLTTAVISGLLFLSRRRARRKRRLTA